MSDPAPTIRTGVGSSEGSGEISAVTLGSGLALGGRLGTTTILSLSCDAINAAAATTARSAAMMTRARVNLGTPVRRPPSMTSM